MVSFVQDYQLSQKYSCIDQCHYMFHLLKKVRHSNYIFKNLPKIYIFLYIFINNFEQLNEHTNKNFGRLFRSIQSKETWRTKTVTAAHYSKANSFYQRIC